MIAISTLGLKPLVTSSLFSVVCTDAAPQWWSQLPADVKLSHTLCIVCVLSPPPIPGLEEVCEGLRLQTGGLKVLLLKNNQITADGMLHLAKALVGQVPGGRLESWARHGSMTGDKGWIEN